VQTAPKSSSLSININSRPCGIPSRLTREIRKDHICLRYLPVSLIEAEIASGKEINIDCEVRGSFEVKECGTHVIVDDPNAMDEYVDSDSVDMVSAKRGRDDNEAGPSNDWSSDENCPKRLRIDLWLWSITMKRLDCWHPDGVLYDTYGHCSLWCQK